MDHEFVLYTSSSGSDTLSVAEPHPQFIDLSDPGGWNSHRELQSSLFGTRNKYWNHIPYPFYNRYLWTLIFYLKNSLIVLHVLLL